MAFQQPIKPASRTRPSPAGNGSHQEYQELLENRERDTREWVLFSPVAPSIPTNGSVITDRTPQTAGLSGASDLDIGDLATVASADGEREYGALDDNSSIQEEEDELESLDSHLHAFGDDVARSVTDQRYNATTILPAHDGYGSFLIPARQEHVKVHSQAEDEDRPKLRRTPLDVQPQIGLGELEDVELVRAMRIEAWRLEQSRFVVEGMGKELSKAAAKRHRGAYNTTADEQRIGPASTGGLTHLIQRVLRDVIGIDDYLLAILLGESLVDEDDGASELYQLSAYGTPSPFDQIEYIEHRISWLNRLLGRIGRELGALAQPTLGHSWGFSVYARYSLVHEDKRDQRRPSPRRHHMGLGSAQSHSSRRTRLSVSDLRPKLAGTRQHSSTTDIAQARFFPSISPDAKLLAGCGLGGLVRSIEAPLDPGAGLCEASTLDQASVVRTDSDEVEDQAQATNMQSELAYWEQRLDVPLVFSFLRNRFRRRTSAASPPLFPTDDKHTPPETHAQPRYPSYPRSFPAFKSPFSAPQSQRPQSPSSSTVPVPASPTPFTAQSTALSRAAAIRHHHPLVPQASQQQQHQQHSHRTSHSSSFPPVPRITSPSLSQGILRRWPKRRGSSSCASESVKSSKRARATSTAYRDDVGEGHWDWSVGSSTTSTRDAASRGFLDEISSPWVHAADAAVHAAAVTTGPLGAWVDI